MQNRSLATQLYVLVVASTLIPALLIVGIALGQTQAVVQDELETQARAQAAALAETVNIYLASGEREPVRRIVLPIGRSNAVDNAVVFNDAQSIIAEATSTNSTLTPINIDEKLPYVAEVLTTGQPVTLLGDQHISALMPIRFQQEIIGVAYIRLGVERVQARLLEVVPLLGLAVAGVAALALLVAVFAARTIAQPLRTLSGYAARVGQGDLVAVPALQRRDEIGALWGAFDGMVSALQTAQQQVTAQQAVLEQRVTERTATLETTLAELRASVAEREQLSDMVRELATPIVPVLRGVLVMPLVGAIDTLRAEALLSALLAGIEQHHARLVILDATGVPVIDTHVARVLLQAADAAQLLGARVSLVGLRPEVAQTIVGLGLDLSRLDTRADLESAVRTALGGR